jgi:aspartate carbamoyltransferase catalytic subunit
MILKTKLGQTQLIHAHRRKSVGKFPKHILSVEQFDQKMIEQLFEETTKIKANMEGGKETSYIKELEGKFLLNIFWETSTRTMCSFDAAAQWCGMMTFGIPNAPAFSSVAKGESLGDTVRTLAGYHANVIVLRHPIVGAATEAAQVIDKHRKQTSIINGGDGTGEHPTQALTDLYTIQNEGQLENIHILFGGDPRYGRTIHSLARLLARYNNVEMTFAAPEELQIDSELKTYLETKKVRYTTETDPRKVFPHADFVYWTRVQKERMDSELFAKLQHEGTFTIGPREMDLMKPTARLLHPLPRVGEISTDIDHDSRSAYFRQAENGMYVRMALLLDLLRKSK